MANETPASTSLRRPHFSALPEADGLYDPRFEHDACGVSFVADVKGRRSRDIVATALGALCRLDHRGASGAEVIYFDRSGFDPETGTKARPRSSPGASQGRR